MNPTSQPSPHEPERVIHITDPISVGELADALNLKWFVVVRTLMSLNVFANRFTPINFTIASAVCSRHGVTARKVA